MTLRTYLRGGAVAAAAGALIAAPMAAPAFAADDDPTIDGYRSVGYIMSDVPETRGYQISDIIRTGAIDDITHINYAFGNVTDDLICDITDVTASGDETDPANDNASDRYNDYLRIVSAEDSVDGVADDADQALAGNFNQLRKLKDAYPDKKVLISLGGWNWSRNFSEAVATPESRETLINSCIDLYLDGDLPVDGDQGGDGVAAGIFDGFDIDWEWPGGFGAADNGVDEENDEANFYAFMTEFREALDAYGADHDGKHYLLSAFAPIGQAAGGANWFDHPELFDAVDYLNMQGYDYAGGWMADTGHASNLFPDGDENWGTAAAPFLENYVAAGADPSQINLGIPIYGQGWKGVENGGAAWQEADGSFEPSPLYEVYDVGEGYLDTDVASSWRWDEESGDWWSIDSPETVNQKASYVADNQLGGVMWWDLSGDVNNCLVGTAANTFRDGADADLVQCGDATFENEPVDYPDQSEGDDGATDETNGDDSETDGDDSATDGDDGATDGDDGATDETEGDDGATDEEPGDETGNETDDASDDAADNGSAITDDGDESATDADESDDAAELADTGSDLLGGLALAVLLLGAGTGAVVVNRRRRAHTK